MKDNTSVELNKIQKVNAPSQRRGPYSSSEFTTRSDTQSRFDPSSSSREMRKIMYYENMFSRMASQDKTRKNQTGSQPSSASQTNSPVNDGDDAEGVSRNHHVKHSKISAATKKGSTNKTTQDKTKLSAVLMDSNHANESIDLKEEGISVSTQENSLNSLSGTTYEDDQKLKYSANSSTELKEVLEINRNDDINTESNVDSSEADTSRRSSNNSLPSVTDIAGSKISKLLGIDQTARNPSELSASQRQWLVPTFQIVQPKPVKKEPLDSPTNHVGNETPQNEEIDETKGAVDTQEQQLSEHSNGKRTNLSTLQKPSKTQSARGSQQADERKAPRDSAMDLESESKQLDIIVNEEDMEIDPVLKDEMEEEPVIIKEEDEEYLPETPVQNETDFIEKKPQKRKARQKKSVQQSVQSVTAANNDLGPSPDATTPENGLANDNYPEPPPVIRPTKTRTSARNTGKQRKRDPNFIHESEMDHPVPAKTPRSSARSGARGTPSSSRKNAQEHGLSKAHNIAQTMSMHADTQEHVQKKTRAVSRIISVAEAEKIVELYRQHNTDLERLKKLILMGDLTEVGRVIAEQREEKTPQRSCILDPRIIAAQPGTTQVKVNQDPPPKDPITLSLKYRLISRLMEKSNTV
ncbi:hypothetical protein X943_003188 [Babesia divergens]|uniref:Uncharacterized protein n=1 Tax=Babesia divergens TaxID=32595 RepID=A0AAD9LF74_BABDI|nr:hypothetical protein X943_003188 [Babesia divergens]